LNNVLGLIFFRKKNRKKYELYSTRKYDAAILNSDILPARELLGGQGLPDASGE
jgi:hypothetical protein